MKLYALTLILLSPVVFAAPYVEYKNEYDVAKESQTHHLRAGYKTKGGYYLEAGKMNAGWSSELGYKQKFGNFELKGKFETKKKDFSKPKSKLETELRYTFK